MNYDLVHEIRRDSKGKTKLDKTTHFRLLLEILYTLVNI